MVENYGDDQQSIYPNIKDTLTEASPSGGMLMSVVRLGAGSVQKSSALDIIGIIRSGENDGDIKYALVDLV